jgi:hypothetical protein
MLNFCGIVAAILKMETSRNFSMSGINSGHHNLPTYEMSLKSDNVEFVRYCGGHFENKIIVVFRTDLHKMKIKHQIIGENPTKRFFRFKKADHRYWKLINYALT